MVLRLDPTHLSPEFPGVGTGHRQMIQWGGTPDEQVHEGSPASMHVCVHACAWRGGDKSDEQISKGSD